MRGATPSTAYLGIVVWGAYPATPLIVGSGGIEGAGPGIGRVPFSLSFLLQFQQLMRLITTRIVIVVKFTPHRAHGMRWDGRHKVRGVSG